ncbi:MAG: DUF5320 domain-containing protein [Firmicutes bacterium]|nr:DUF5320 domain-containing protein [Bacillota bacterium]
MPGFDGTGPRGQGAMTGGGRGFCVLPRRRPPRGGSLYRVFGQGLGRGMGRGRRRGFW